MIIREYLEKNRMQLLEFAALVGIGYTTAYRLLKGDIPSARIARKIEQATKKSITVEELRKKDAKG